MRRLSLTTRMSLMFMLGVISVLTVTGLSFHALAKHHFKNLDRQILEEKLESTTKALTTTHSEQDFMSAQPQLHTLLGAHAGLSAFIFNKEGVVIFTEPSLAKVPVNHDIGSGSGFFEWTERGHKYRGMASVLPEGSRSFAESALLVLDVTSHEHFFEKLQHWFWIGLVVSAFASALLGWIVARSGLRPLRKVTQVASAMSARSLKERISLERVPQELQELVFSFNEMLARLDDAFVRLSNFSADIAHELRTPISNLKTHTEVVLSQERKIESYQDNLYANLDDLNKISRIIDDMLFLAKSDNGLIIPKQENIELNALVCKLVEYYEVLAEELKIQFKVAGHGHVLGDMLMLSRAISNLISNALRYTPPHNVISIIIATEPGFVTLSVINPGETISPEHLDHLFDRFYRADPARRDGDPSNAGLGLAITRSIISAHNGEIWCTSNENVTAFHTSFPQVVSQPG